MSVAAQVDSSTNQASTTDNDGGLISANSFAVLAMESDEINSDQDAIDIGILSEVSQNKTDIAEDSVNNYPVGSDPQIQPTTPVVGNKPKSKKNTLIEGQMRLDSFNMRSSRSLDRNRDKKSRKSSESAKRSINHSDKSPTSTNSPNKKQKHASKPSLGTEEKKVSGLQPSTGGAGTGRTVDGGSYKINANADFDWYNLRPIPT